MITEKNLTHLCLHHIVGCVEEGDRAEVGDNTLVLVGLGNPHYSTLPLLLRDGAGY